MTDSTSFYVTGGTLRPDAPSYLERRADRGLYEGLVRGEFCYVLTSRQMGKSSLMVRTANRLREQKINVVALDLTAIGLNLSPEQWYDGLILRMGRQLHLEEPLEDFWMNNPRLSPVQRLFTAIREVAMERCSGPFVIFVDEIDTVRSLPFSTDEFFAAIRECYNRRVEDPGFSRLSFCLLGVATPSDLIRDTRTTPFNIGHRIELTDFTDEEAAPLASGLLPDPSHQDTSQARLLLDRILHWTGGHPYLTQRLCRATAHSLRVGSLVTDDPDRGSGSRATHLTPSVKLVDQLCEELFLSPRARERDDNLLFVRERVLRSPTDLVALLELYEQIRNRQRVRDSEADDLINQLRLAGITRVVNGFLQVRNRIYYRVFDREWVQANLMAATRTENPSIAVLPFVNLQPGKEHEYLSDGITEDIITALSQVKGLRVPARTSAFVFKGKNRDIRKVGELLRVATVLEGSVRKGNKLRISAQLIKVADGLPIWSQRYDREMQDVFAIQDEISRAIVEALKVKLVEEGGPLAKSYTENTEAYQLYLKGRYYWNQRDAALRKAVHYFELALLEDPKLALAYTGLADTYVMLGSYGYLTAREALTKGKEAAEKALAIDESLAEGHASLAAVIGYYEPGWETAEKEYLRAIELNQNYAPAHSWYSLNLSLRGRHAAAIAEAQAALELDPLSLPGHCVLAWAFYFAHLYDQAQGILGSALDKNPYFMLARLILGHVYAITGRHEEALNELEKAVAIAPDSPVPLSTLGYTYALARKREKAAKVLQDLLDKSKKEYVRAYLIAYVLNGLGRVDETIEWLDRACEERDMWVPFINVEPAFDSIRGDPRFQQLLTRVGLGHGTFTPAAVPETTSAAPPM